MTTEQRAEQVVGYPGSLARDVAAAIRAAVAEEREACAKLAEDIHFRGCHEDLTATARIAAKHVAAAIRDRGNR